MESLAAALPILSSSGIPAISLGVRSEIIAEDSAKNNWLFYRMCEKLLANTVIENYSVEIL